MKRNIFGQCAALAFFFAFVGCGKPTGELKGKVLLGKDPMPGGSLTFEFTGGESAVVPIRNDGSFSADALPVGTASVGVTPPAAPKGFPGMESKMKAPKGMEGKENYYGNTKGVKMKDKFKTPSSSGLKAEVKAGKNPEVTFNVD